MLRITNLDYIENLKYQVKISHSYGGNATSLATINSFAQGISYTNIVAKSKVIAISLPNYKFSQSFSSVSSMAT